MKISLITACYNSAATIRTAIESVLSQKGVDVEYIIVDGGSTDGTVEVIEELSRKERKDRKDGFEFKWISERDRGMYDAINKGIKMATGDVVGILNADDVLASDETLAHITSAFEPPEVGSQKSEVDCVYADIRFVKRRDVASPSQGGASPSRDGVGELRKSETVRYCSAKRWRPWMFRFAAMVPHPSFYVRRECFERLGGYSLDYRICANGVWSCFPLIYFKYLFKIWGFVCKRG